MVAALLM